MTDLLNSPVHKLRSSLFRKYAVVFGSLVSGALLASGLVAMFFSYHENVLSLINLQQEKANSAAMRISEYLFEIERDIGATALPPAGKSLRQQRQLEVQLLRNNSAIREVALLDFRGHEYLRVSRLAADQVDSGRDFSKAEFFRQVISGRPYRSPIYFRDGSLYILVAMAVGPEEAGITVAEVALEFLLDGIRRIYVGAAGYAYAIDADGRLIAHPDIALVLNNTSMADLPQVRAVIADRTPGKVMSDNLAVSDGSNATAHSLDGTPVLSAHSRIQQLGWYVFVEEPMAEAYRPLYAGIWRALLLILASLALTMLVSIMLVRRMVSPIRTLQKGAALIGGGQFAQRIEVRTGDELEDLADSFNRMAKHLQKSYATLEDKVAQRTWELEESNRKLEALSATDGLTGLANRRRFDQVLDSEWQRAMRSSQPLALLLLDVDQFKAYNDIYGHLVGDDGLRALAGVLQNSARRGGDLAARYGGEEFAIIAPGSDGEKALLLAEGICQSISTLNIPHSGSAHGVLTASIGVAVIVPHSAMTQENLLQQADQALYEAKHGGRNRVVMRVLQSSLQNG